MRRTREHTAVAVLAMALALAGCGGGGSDGGNSGGTVAVSPPPPSSTPTTPAQTPAPTLATVAIAGAMPGQTLAAPEACAVGVFSFTGNPPRLDGIRSIRTLGLLNGQPGNGLDIVYRDTDSYDLIFGFDDVGLIRPGDKRISQTVAYDNFNLGNSFEFEIYRNVGAQSFQYVTLGRQGSMITADPVDTGYACFYAAGREATLPASGTGGFIGFADGVALVGGRASRLFGSAASASIDFAARTGTVRIDLAGRDAPFREFVGATAMPIGQATAQFALNPGASYIDDAPLSGPGGSSGTITGLMLGGGRAIAFAFELRFPNGDRAFGAVAVETGGSGGADIWAY